jgi:hypothetical protein
MTGQEARPPEEGGRTPKRGDRFVHARKMDGQSRPLVCRVTQVRHSREGLRGWVIYRSHDGAGSKWTVDLDTFSDIVKEWLA